MERQKGGFALLGGAGLLALGLAIFPYTNIAWLVLILAALGILYSGANAIANFEKGD